MSNDSIAFVATEQIPPSPPPSSAVGPVKWIKDNLFSGILNSVLTLLSIAFVAVLLYELVPWFWDSSWHPEEMSLKGCRAEASGACFAVLVERFWQFIFGFYPVEHYWRPTLAFALLIVSLWPVLFSSAPRKLLILTAVYPLLGYWLIWGGSIWGPLAVLAGVILGVMIISKGESFFDNVIGEAFGPCLLYTSPSPRDRG